ncbi:MAG: DUF1667 domain-containing protein [Clostridiales bacterium]|nr:DUF1667 domain-containing protein [Clostridiales bacterium]
MRKITEVICPCCPNECHVRVDETNGNAVTGNGCSNGEAFAIHELTNPKRRVEGEVRVTGGILDRCRVKTDQVVPMETLGNIAQALSELVIEAPITVSQVLVRDLAGTGANLLACQTIVAVEAEEDTANTETE